MVTAKPVVDTLKTTFAMYHPLITGLSRASNSSRGSRERGSIPGSVCLLASALDDCVDSCGLVGVAAAGAKLLNPRAMSLTAVFSEDGNTGAVARAPMIALIVFLMVASRPLAVVAHRPSKQPSTRPTVEWRKGAPLDATDNWPPPPIGSVNPMRRRDSQAETSNGPSPEKAAERSTTNWRRSLCCVSNWYLW
ncbi:hypothetical protein OOU_Y34scaffold00534g70 [Pyricularia oryzae Y34]|uniref:Uncharacterized protein n=2 Tax=Pyricularia oryzae TaxID=318829 RepID=A0AA97NYC1_PYRO3|nr:hypothetical protein OOU_Y34scaffold00534g70 [Pyricularia oryzae Y34]